MGIPALPLRRAIAQLLWQLHVSDCPILVASSP
jgi:hypothetical protein